MPMLTSPTANPTTCTTTRDPGLACSDEPFRVRLAAALAASGRDGRPFTVTDRASAPTHRYRAMA